MLPRLIIALILVSGGIALVRYFVQPELAEVRVLRQEQLVVSNTITDAREVIRLQQTLQSRYNSISISDIEKIRKFLPAGSTLSEFLIDVDTLIKEAGVSVETISFSEESEEAGNTADRGIQVLTVSLSITGTYEEFRELLTLFEQNLRLIDLVDITLKSAEEDGIMGFDLILQTYYQQRAIL